MNAILKVAVASLIGTSIEWYDFFLYNTAAALVFNKLFFPTFAPLAGTIAAFATYTVGFMARPIGGGGGRKTFIAVDIFRFASTGTSCRKKCLRKKQWPVMPCLRGRKPSGAYRRP